ncbi:hypothetical protein BC826DRAFT_317874 [Russula brevipes]|nr:hypothetical protein BC826DRAFT_317874 [Russula brevipes]
MYLAHPFRLARWLSTRTSLLLPSASVQEACQARVPSPHGIFRSYHSSLVPECASGRHSVSLFE